MARLVTFGLSFILFYTTALQVDGAKILMFPVSTKSHALELACLAEELVSRGNEVYFILHEDQQIPAVLEKLQGAQILAFPRDAFGPISNIDETLDNITLRAIEGNNDFAEFTKDVAKILADMCKPLLLENEEAILQLERIKADVLITNYAVVWKCPYLLSHRLGIPTIAFGNFVEPWIARIPYLPSYVPTYFLPFNDQMSFTERSKNAFVAFMAGFFQPYREDLTDVIDAYQRYGEIRDIDSLVADQTLLFLYSTHLVLDYPKPSMPNVVAAGGMTCQPGKPLPEDVLDIVNKSRKGGVILVAFGAATSYFPSTMTQRFVAAFASFPEYTFLWRFNNKDNLEIPLNVMAKRWLPQNDLLANSNIKLFITHCGQRSLFEAVYHAKPLIGVPLFYDQKYNARVLKTKGYGEIIDVLTFNSDELRQKLKMVLEDGSYKARVETASEIFHDDPETPRQRVSRMVEQVIKHGAGHLRSSAYDLSWYQYWMLDIAAVVCTVSFVVLYISYRIVIRFR